MSKSNDSLSQFKIVENTNSKYLKPLRVEFTINKVNKYWDFLKVHDSVSILIYNRSRKVVVLVRQFRPSAYLVHIPNLSIGDEIDTSKYPVDNGYTIELCAGIVDKDIPLEDVAREEVLEECGYDIPASRLKKILSFRGVGVNVNRSHIFYAEVEDKEKVASGGGLQAEGEFIEIVEMSLPDFRAYVESVELKSPAGLAAAAFWFFMNVAD